MSEKINESLDFQGVAKLLNLPAPGTSTEPVRQTDLDTAINALKAAIAGFSFIDIVARLASTTNVNIASAPANLDSTAGVNGDVWLLTGQTDHHENGLWVFNGTGAALTRATVQGDPITFQAGSVVVVGPDGSANKNSLWLQTTDSPVVGATVINFTQFGSTISAGTGLTLTGTTIALNTPVSVGNGGTGAASASAARTALSASGLFNATFGDGSATTFSINHGLGNSYPLVMIYNTSSGQKEDCAVATVDANHVSLSAEAWTASPPGAGAYHVIVVG